MWRLAPALVLFASGVAFAQQAPAPAAPAPAAPAAAAPSAQTTPAAASSATKHDQGTVRTVDTQRGTCIADLPDGPVTYDVSQAQLIDSAGKPAGVATSGIKSGDRVRITYTVDDSCPSRPACRGAIASEVRLLK